MRIAVVGAGIAGLAAAWLLSRQHEVVLYESDRRAGGHTHTHDVEVSGRRYAVDTGFIVFNPDRYPQLSRLFAELGVATRATTMSFSVHEEASGLEYNAGTLDGLFCQRRNLLRPRFLGMLADILRFYREAPRVLDELDARRPDAPASPTLGDYLDANGYGAAFRDLHIVPMASALWSSPTARILEFPLHHLLRFMANHQMLQARGRPTWRVVDGGSRAYVHALRARWRVEERLGTEVTSVRRTRDGVYLQAAAASERYDHVVLACHSDQALALLADPTPAETSVLGAMPYQVNDVVLHTDARVLPRDRKAWAAWNAFVPALAGDACTVSYCMNVLQGFASARPLVVTLNRSAAIDPNEILWRGQYAHPLQNAASAAAQLRKAEIQGRRGTWFAGAYWGTGFHEDGMRSGVDVAEALGVAWT